MRTNQILPRSYVTRSATVWLTLLLLAVFGASQRVAQAQATRHPLYDDGGTLRWYASLAEARAVAAREGRLIFVDLSLPNSPACANVVALIRDPAIRDRVSRLVVGHHVDARRGSRFVREFRRNLRSGARLPWMGFFTPDLTWVAGFAPSRRTTRAEMRRRFLAALRRGEAHQRLRVARRRHAPSPAAPRVSSTREVALPTADASPGASSTRGVPSRKSKPASAGSQSRTSPASGLVWFKKISEARAAAQAEGKVILVTSTKPSCSLCKKLRNRVIPKVWRELSKGCVLYVYDITKPESRAVDRIVRRNLPHARLMPLSGFMTADGRWLHGFFGGTDKGQLLSDYRTAMRKR